VARLIEALEGGFNTLVHYDTLQMMRVGESHGFFEDVLRMHSELSTRIQSSEKSA
jgi:type II secretory pathway component PulF